MFLRLLISLVIVMVLSPQAVFAGVELRDVYKQVKGSVLVILTKQQVNLQDKQKTTAQGLGSGFLISEDGKVMTAAHVVQTAIKVKVMFPDKTVVDAQVIGTEPAADVALLQLEKVPQGAVVAKLGDSDTVEVGDDVFVVGAPYGLSYTLTAGYISARHNPNTLLGQMALAEFFQTDAAINQGNSGGPMFNMNGEVIGIVSHILSQSGGFEGLGFVVTTKTARELLLKRKSRWSGFEGLLLQGDMTDIFNLPQKKAILVQHVAPGSPAERIGLKESTIPIKIGDHQFFVGGDIILGMDGMSIADDNGYARIKKHLSTLKKGTKVKIHLFREGVKRDLVFKIRE